MINLNLFKSEQNCAFIKDLCLFGIILVSTIFFVFSSCSKPNLCEGITRYPDSTNYNVYIKSNNWANFTNIKQYNFLVKNGSNLTDKLILNIDSNINKEYFKSEQDGWNNNPDCPVYYINKYYYKVYKYKNGTNTILSILNNGKSYSNNLPKWKSEVELSFLDSKFNFFAEEIYTINSKNFYDSINFENKWFYNVYKLKSIDTLASLYLNYENGIVKYEKDSTNWTNNN